MRYKSFGVFTSSLCVLLAGFVLLCFGILLPADSNFTFIGDGGRITYAFGSSSSNAVFVDEDDFADGTKVIGYKAVSVYFSGKATEDYITEIVKKYAAEEVYSEIADGVTCRYFYSEKIPFYKVLYIGGQDDFRRGDSNAVFGSFFKIFGRRSPVKVNIHVAVSGCGITVGSPMIYCGY